MTNKDKRELEFLSPYYPIPCEDLNKPITFFFTPLNILTEEEFDSVLKISDITSVVGQNNSELRFSIFKSIFVKTENSQFSERMLSYRIKTQTKLNTFKFVDFLKMRDKKYTKEKKAINFIVGCSIQNKDLIIKSLPLDVLIKQIKAKTLVDKKYVAIEYNNYIDMLAEQCKENKDKLIPLQEGNLHDESVITLSDLKDFLIPGCKAHKLGELLQTLKTNIGVKEFKKSKNFGRIYELRGEPIRYFYNEKNYTKLNKDGCSILYNSCMRHNSCFEQLKFYSNNPESIALLVVMDEEDPKKIVARTILWTTVSGKKVIDRVYYNRQDDVNILITYCKSMGYETVHYPTASNYGLKKHTDAIIHIENAEDTGLPYFDTMKHWEKINSLLAEETGTLRNYCASNKLDYILINPGGWCTNRSADFRIKGSSTFDYISDVYGNPITNRAEVIAIDLPSKGYFNHGDVELIGYPLRKVLRSAGGFISKLKKKYNCVSEAICRTGYNTYTKYIDDKKNLVYSTVLKTYIDRKDSYFNYQLGGYIYKESLYDPKIKNIYRERKLRSCYANKSTHLTQEGYEYFKQLNENLVVPLDIIKIRPSRKFKIHPKNVKLNGVSLKNIIVPFKYLKIIKHNG